MTPAVPNYCCGCYADLSGPCPRCGGCGRWLHPDCWAKYGCTNPHCRDRRPALAEPPPPPDPQVEWGQAYPWVDGPTPLLTDVPLGLSVGTVDDRLAPSAEVRNNTHWPLVVRVPVLPPWASVRVVPGGPDEVRADGLAVIPAGQTRRLSVAFHAVRPVADATVHLTACRLDSDVRLTPERPTAVRLRSHSQPPQAAASGFAVLAAAGLVVWGCFTAAVFAHTNPGTVAVLGLSVVPFAVLAAGVAPGLAGWVLARPVVWLARLFPTAHPAREFAHTAGLLVADETGPNKLSRRVALAGGVAALGVLVGQLVWWLLLLVAWGVFPVGGWRVLPAALALVTLAAGWCVAIQPYGGVGEFRRRLFPTKAK